VINVVLCCLSQFNNKITGLNVKILPNFSIQNMALKIMLTQVLNIFSLDLTSSENKIMIFSARLGVFDYFY
jgi:hypothetical protein